MDWDIHKVVARRLLLAALLLSPLFGGLVAWLELHRIDHLVLDLIDREAVFEQQLIDRLPAPGVDDAGHFQDKAVFLTEQHFVMIDVYDPAESHVAIAVRVGDDWVHDFFERRHHAFPLDRSLHYERFYIQDRFFMQVLKPLWTSNNELAGYFEGVYEVDHDVVEQIEARVVQAVLMAMGGIFLTSLLLYPVIIYLNRQLICFAREVFQANVEMLEVMGSAIAKRDSTTDSHNYRVTLYALRMGENLGMEREQLRDLAAGAFLHDVGKIGIRDAVLGKPGRLTDEEMVHMRKHVTLGLDIVDKAKWLSGARDVIQYHHEKYDGSGYDQGLKGEEIPINARIFAIVDVFDALTSERPYKKAMTAEQALAILEEGRGSHFDPELLDRFALLADHLYQRYGRAAYSLLSRRLAVDVRRYFFEASIQKRQGCFMKGRPTKSESRSGS